MYRTHYAYQCSVSVQRWVYNTVTHKINYLRQKHYRCLLIYVVRLWFLPPVLADNIFSNKESEKWNLPRWEGSILLRPSNVLIFIESVVRNNLIQFYNGVYCFLGGSKHVSFPTCEERDGWRERYIPVICTNRRCLVWLHSAGAEFQSKCGLMWASDALSRADLMRICF